MSVAAEPDVFAERLARRDPALFGRVPSQTTAVDRGTLLALQEAVRRAGDYAYLEIGSHLGGTLQPHLADPRCRRIYSVDKRPAEQPDVRGLRCRYDDNTTARMLAGLRAAFGEEAVARVTTFDCDAAEVPRGAIAERPRLCFIDGEHTTAAVRRDFALCRAVAAPDAIVALHDALLLHEAILRCRGELERDGAVYRGLKLPGAVYAFFLGAAAEREGAAFARLAEGERAFRRAAAVELARERMRARWQRAITAGWHAAYGMRNRCRDLLRKAAGR